MFCSSPFDRVTQISKTIKGRVNSLIGYHHHHKKVWVCDVFCYLWVLSKLGIEKLPFIECIWQVAFSTIIYLQQQ